MSDGVLAPGATIGILGGGQLGRMLAMAGARLGLRSLVYEPQVSGPAAEVTNQHMVGAYLDEERLAAFARRAEVITYEFENVPSQTAAFLERLRPVRPGRRLLEVAQDRLLEKSFFVDAGIATAPFMRIDGPNDLAAALARVGPRAVLKTRRFGYDGKGQARIDAATDPAAAWGAIGAAPAILEGFVDFERELSVVAARGLDGRFTVFDLVENEHRDHILWRSVVPAEVAPATAEAAYAIARKIGEALGAVGVYAVELFLCGGGERLLVNEIAPRVHNTGHWTIEGAETSQFEQHIRAICGWPLGPTRRLARSVEMRNILGADAQNWRAYLAEPGLHVHLYGKEGAVPGRKMGHVTRLRI